jgi:hypothetical protein
VRGHSRPEPARLTQGNGPIEAFLAALKSEGMAKTGTGPVVNLIQVGSWRE